MVAAQMKHLTASKLRLILLGFMLFLLVLGTGLFLLYRQFLIDYSIQVAEANNSATISNDEVTRLKNLEVRLTNDSVAVNRAKKIVSDSKSYQYQNQIIDDINSYASAAGLKIAGFNFSSDDAVSSTADPAAPIVPGLKSTDATITIENPVSYISIMKFIHAIENNLTKIQVTGISISKATKSNDVVVNPISIRVYVK
ncbi:hypothetical protein KC953_01435 [Candidatus Saccharibacteria bacterium]|nr:hypothetical protein [Candidatus Saccharibacteria bacterium]